MQLVPPVEIRYKREIQNKIVFIRDGIRPQAGPFVRSEHGPSHWARTIIRKFPNPTAPNHSTSSYLSSALAAARPSICQSSPQL